LGLPKRKKKKKKKEKRKEISTLQSEIPAWANGVDSSTVE
jgi:hypothetical protein